MSDRERRTATPERPHPTEVFRYLQRRDWELWSIALLLLTIFAASLLAFFYYGASQQAVAVPGAARYIWAALFGLVTLVVLVNLYLIEKKRELASLWRRLLLQQEESEQERERRMLDPLTQVYSRRFFEEFIAKEVRRCDRTGRPLSFLLVDIDGFRQINEQGGHFVGDEVLRVLAEVMQDVLRASDYTFRYGGDEFLAALPDTPAEGAVRAGQRLRVRLAGRKELPGLIGRPLTVSIGHAQYSRGQDLEMVLEEAERAAAQKGATVQPDAPRKG